MLCGSGFILSKGKRIHFATKAPILVGGVSSTRIPQSFDDARRVRSPVIKNLVWRKVSGEGKVVLRQIWGGAETSVTLITTPSA